MTTDGIGPTTLIVLTRDGMGEGDEALRSKLLTTYLTLLAEHDVLPGAICFYTDGVKLVAEGSAHLDLLRTLESKGVHLIVCATCLKHYGLFDKVAVGIVGGMTDIISAQGKAAKVITL